MQIVVPEVLEKQNDLDNLFMYLEQVKDSYTLKGMSANKILFPCRVVMGLFYFLLSRSLTLVKI